MPSLPSRRRIDKFIKPFRVTDGKKFKLKHIDPDDTGGLKSKEAATKFWPQASSGCASFRTSSMPRTGGRCCSCSRRWTRRARTAPSST